jgi:ABC-type xylose transport system permease subunit
MDTITMILNILIGMITATLLTVAFWWANKSSGTTTINYVNLAGYVIVGAIFGAYNGYAGVEVTMPSVVACMTTYAVIILAIDQFLAGWFKTPVATFMLKYTGHSFYPKFTLELNDGTIQTFNTETTGRCCCIGVAMQPKSQQWSPGFKVTPAFADGVSPYTVALNLTTGRNPDLSAIKQVTVDWMDGSVVEKVPMALGKEGNPVGVASHTFTFNGN